MISAAEYQQQVQKYQKLIASGVPPGKAFAQAFPNGVPSAAEVAKMQAQQKGQNALASVGGLTAGALTVKGVMNAIDGKPILGSHVSHWLGLDGAAPATQTGSQVVANAAPEVASQVGSQVASVGADAVGTQVGSEIGSQVASMGADAAGSEAAAMASQAGSTAAAAEGSQAAAAGTPLGAYTGPLLMAYLIGKTLYDSSKKHDRQWKLDEVLGRNRFGQQVAGYDTLNDNQKSKFVSLMHDQNAPIQLQGYADDKGNTVKYGNAVLTDPFKAQAFLRDKSAGGGGAGNPINQYEQTQKLYDDLLAKRATGGRIQYYQHTDTGSSRGFDVDAQLEKLKQNLAMQQALMAQVQQQPAQQPGQKLLQATTGVRK